MLSRVKCVQLRTSSEDTTYLTTWMVRRMAATLGKVEEFNNSREDWPQYEERLGHFFTANGITEGQKRAVLLTVIGPSAYKVLRNLVSPKKPNFDSSGAELLPVGERGTSVCVRS